MSGLFDGAIVDRIRKQAKRILAGMVKGSIDRPIFPGYISFDQHRRPCWWRDDFVSDDWGEILGVHEANPDCSDDAIVVAERGLGVFDNPIAPNWVPYEAIEGWEKLSKEPISSSLVVRTNVGNRIELVFPRGGAFAFIQFLGYATEQLFRARNTEEGKLKPAGR